MVTNKKDTSDYEGAKKKPQKGQNLEAKVTKSMNKSNKYLKSITSSLCSITKFSTISFHYSTIHIQAKTLYSKDLICNKMRAFFLNF